MISAQPPRDSLEEALKEETRGQSGECHASDQDRVRLTLGAGFDSVDVVDLEEASELADAAAVVDVDSVAVVVVVTNVDVVVSAATAFEEIVALPGCVVDDSGGRESAGGALSTSPQTTKWLERRPKTIFTHSRNGHPSPAARARSWC